MRIAQMRLRSTVTIENSNAAENSAAAVGVSFLHHPVVRRTRPLGAAVPLYNCGRTLSLRPFYVSILDAGGPPPPSLRSCAAGIYADELRIAARNRRLSPRSTWRFSLLSSSTQRHPQGPALAPAKATHRRLLPLIRARAHLPFALLRPVFQDFLLSFLHRGPRSPTSRSPRSSMSHPRHKPRPRSASSAPSSTPIAKLAKATLRLTGSTATRLPRPRLAARPCHRGQAETAAAGNALDAELTRSSNGCHRRTGSASQPKPPEQNPLPDEPPPPSPPTVQLQRSHLILLSLAVLL